MPYVYFKLNTSYIKLKYGRVFDVARQCCVTEIVFARPKINVPWKRPVLTVCQSIGKRWLIIRAGRRGTLSTNLPWTKALDEKGAVSRFISLQKSKSFQTSWPDTPPASFSIHSILFIRLAPRGDSETRKQITARRRLVRPRSAPLALS